MVRINTNIESLKVQRFLNINSFSLEKTLKRLSTGLRVNSAADDAAGMAIGKGMQTRRISNHQSIENIQMGQNYIRTAEQGLNTTLENLQRIRELIIDAANDTKTTSDREKIQVEIDLLMDEIDNLGKSTEFNGKKPFTIAPERLKELTDIPGSVDISFVVDSSGSMGAEIGAVVAGLAGFIGILDAAELAWQISVSESAGTAFNPVANPGNNPATTAASYAMSRSADFFDWTRTNLDLTMDAAAINNQLNDILTMMNGYGLAGKRVDLYNSGLEVADFSFDTAGDPNAPAGLGIDRNGGVPGGVGDDFVNRRPNTTYYQIWLTDTIPESGLFSDGTIDRSGTQPDQPTLPGVHGNDGMGNPIYGAVAGGVGMGMNTPNFYGNQQREVAVANSLAAVGAMVFVVAPLAMNFNPGDGTANRAGSTFYDDIAAITGGGTIDIGSFVGADLQPVADAIVAGSLLRPGILVTDPGAVKVQVAPDQGGFVSLDQVHLNRESLGLVNIDVTNPNLNTDMENYWRFTDTDGNELISTGPMNPPGPPAAGTSPSRVYRGTPKYIDTNPPASLIDYTGYDDMIIQVDTAIERTVDLRSRFGAQDRAMDLRLEDLTRTDEALARNFSRIMDTDYAFETGQLAKTQIIQQAAQSLLVQANSLPSIALNLLAA